MQRTVLTYLPASAVGCSAARVDGGVVLREVEVITARSSSGNSSNRSSSSSSNLFGIDKTNINMMILVN